MQNKEIRFIDSHYNELFRIPDGGKIEIQYDTGEKNIRECKYIDEYHTKIGSNVFHICEFAEIMERNGSTYKAVETPLFSLEHIEPEDKEHLYKKTNSVPRGCIGYVRGDYGSNGKEFHSTWFPDEEKLYTDDFRNDLNDVINYFRESSEMPLLKSRADMYNVCTSLNAPKHENHGLTIYALKLETEKHTYYFCCNPSQHDYNFRVMCYDAHEHLKYKNELVMLTHLESTEKDKFFLTENGAVEMYYNPDSNAGGQVVINEISMELIKEAANHNKDADDFCMYLEGGCNQRLIDIDTYDFKEKFLEFVNKKADFEGINDKTMKGLKKHAGVDKKKTEPER